MKIKICGMKQAENIREVARLNPDFMGFIFYPKSPRYVVGSLNPEVLRALPPNIIKTGVFVNESLQMILDLTKQFGLTAIQLHGEESPEFCEQLNQLGFVVIKAFGVTETFNFEQLVPYDSHCDYYLFDTKTPLKGGSGNKFNWSILEKYDNRKPMFLSGGIGEGDEEDIQKLGHLNIAVLDLNSKFETEPGFKNVGQLKTFIHTIHKGAPKWSFGQ